MDHEGNAVLKSQDAARFDLAVVDTDSRLRTKLVMQLALNAQPVALESIAQLEESLSSDRPTVVVLGPSFVNPHSLEQAMRLKAIHPTIGIVLATEELSVELMQAAMRAGVSDVVGLVGGDTTLAQAVERVADVLIKQLLGGADAIPQDLGRLVLSFSTKGGVGKSTISSNLAVALSQRLPNQVALVDADLQFGDIAVLLSIPPRYTVLDAVAAINDNDPEFMKNFTTEHEASGLAVLPAPVEPSAADQIKPQDMLAIVNRLRQHFAFVVVDMPPHFDDMVLTLIDAADTVLLIASMDIPSIKNVKIGMQTLDLLSIAGNKLRLVLNRANAKVRLDIREVEQALGMSAEFPVPSDIAVPQAINRGIPVVLDNPKSPAARAIEDMADKLMADTIDGNTRGGRV